MLNHPQWSMKHFDSFDAPKLFENTFQPVFDLFFKLFLQPKWLLIDPKFTKANAIVTATAAPTSLPAQRVVRPVPRCPLRPRVLQRNLRVRSMGIQIHPRSMGCVGRYFFSKFFGWSKQIISTWFKGEILKDGWTDFLGKLTNFLNKKDDEWSSN